MTAFFTRSWRNAWLDPIRLLLSVAVCVAFLGLCLPGHAGPAVSDGGSLQYDRQDDGVLLSVTLSFDLPGIVQDTLHKGIPLFFVAEAEILRERWYWYDKPVARATRYFRLVYQPLTRRWRLNMSPTSFANVGLGVALSQNFDALEDALSAVQRINRWKIADAAAVDSDGSYVADFRFRLDMSQLARPFQLGVSGQEDWNVSFSRSQRLPPEGGR